MEVTALEERVGFVLPEHRDGLRQEQEVEEEESKAIYNHSAGVFSLPSCAMAVHTQFLPLFLESCIIVPPSFFVRYGSKRSTAKP